MSMDNVDRKEYDDSVNLKNFKFYYQVKMENILSQPSSYPSTGWCVVLSLFARFVCFNRIALAKVYISRFNRLDARREPICGSEDKWQQWMAN
ncbi:hypothetical protein T12_5613 [Trichinella patagoniensis]|uniref:Uncharacterized protein n=1 Tax=Trichinella patagoniensis TaxID=990121 RepID=A0A0V1A0Y2_9BILA|nr:hypothetical protein T12_5613 [Trichinella patagoniensis]